MNFFKEKEEEDGGEAGEGRGARATNTAVLKQNRARRQHSRSLRSKITMHGITRAAQIQFTGSSVKRESPLTYSNAVITARAGGSITPVRWHTNG